MLRNLIFFLMFLPFSGAALSTDPEAPPSEPTSLATTPHVAWAKPLRGGPVRVLFITPQACARDVVELDQRLDARLDAVLLWDAQHLGFDPANPPRDRKGFSQPEVEQRLSEQLGEKWEVLILANFDLALLPEPAQQIIAERITSGAGLLMANHWISRESPLQHFINGTAAVEAQEEILRGVGDTGGRGWFSGKSVFATAEAGSGRVVQFSYPSDPPQTQGLLPLPADPLHSPREHLENGYALILRALLWTAHRMPEVRVTNLIDLSPTGPKEEEIPPGLPPEFIQALRDAVSSQPMRPFVLQMDAPAREDYQLRLQLRRGDQTAPLLAPSAPIGRGQEVAPFEVLSHPGEYYLDVWLDTRKGIEDWFTKKITIPGWPEIRNLRTSKTFLLQHDALELSVEINNVFTPVNAGGDAASSRGGTLYARGTDSLGRIVAEAHAPVSAEGGTISLALQFADLIAPLVEVTVHAIEGPWRDLQPWELLAGPQETLLLPVRLPVRTLQPEVVVGVPTVEEFNARATMDLLRQAGATMVYAPAGDTALVYAAGSRLALVPELARYQPEEVTDNIIRRPCLTAPEYQQKESLRIQEMTGFHWAGGTNLFSLGAANCLVDSDQNICQSASCLAGFREWLHAQYGTLEALNVAWKSSYSAWEEAVPSDRAQARDTGNFAPWLDFRTFMDGVFSTFQGRIRDSVRAVDAEAQVGAGFLGADNPMHGYDWPHLLPSLDFAVVPPAELLTARLRSYRAGATGNAISFGRDTPPAAAWDAVLGQTSSVWWLAAFGTAAAPSARAALYPDGRTSPTFQKLVETMGELREGLGVLIEAAAPDEARVLIYESTASRHLNEVMQAPDAGSLQAESHWLHLLDLLGLPYRYVGPEGLAAAPPKDALLILPAVTAMSDAEVRQIEAWAEKGGRVAADLPPASHDQHGVPRSAPPFEVGAETDPPVVSGIDPSTAAGAEALQKMCEELGISASVPLKDPVFEGRRYHYRLGSAEIIALSASPESRRPQKTRLDFEKGMQVTDLRAQLPLSSSRHATVKLEPGEVALFSALPYEVEGVILLTPETAYTGRRMEVHVGLELKKDAKPGEHVIRLDLSPELGPPIPHYRQFLRLTQGLGQTYIPLARNEKVGKYILSATDLLTGLKQQVLVAVSFVAQE